MYSGTLPATSNQATWSENFQIIDEDGDDPVDLTEVDEIIIEVREMRTQSAILTGSLTGGEITIQDPETDGTFQWRFEVSDMRRLPPKTYEVGIIIESQDDTVQLMIGYLPVLDGIVAT